MLYGDLRPPAYGWRWLRRILGGNRTEQRQGDDDGGDNGENAFIPVTPATWAARMQVKRYGIIAAIPTCLTLILRCIAHFRLTFVK